MEQTFRGRRVYMINGYPAVTWGEHPTARPGRYYVYIHRIIAYEKWGTIVLTRNVHHRDGDRTNWRTANLEVVTPSEHAARHGRKPPGKRHCATCGADVRVKGPRRNLRQVYCSNACRGKAFERAEWPLPERLQAMVEANGYEAVGRNLGVTGAAVKKRLKRYGCVAQR